MLLCFVLCLLWLQQQQISVNGTVLCVEFIVVTATVDIVQCYCVMCGVYCGYSNINILQWYCVLCGHYCGYSNNRYSAMVLCCVCSLLWLRYHSIQCNVTVFCVEFILVSATVDIVKCHFFSVQFIVVTATVNIVQCYRVVCGVYCGYSNSN